MGSLKIFYKFNLWIITFFLFSNFLFSQNQNAYWSKTLKTKYHKLNSLAQTYSLDTSVFVMKLFSAKSEKNTLLKNSDTELVFPLSNGEFCNFKIVRYEMMESQLANKYDDFGTFYGVSKDLKKIRISWTKLGLHAVIKSNETIVIIEPSEKGTISKYIVYDEKEEISYSEEMKCEVTFSDSERSNYNTTTLGDCQFRTYRLAITSNWKFSNDRGAYSHNDEGILLSEIVNTVNFMNLVFENDLAIRLILVDNVTNLFFYDEQSDPFTSNGATIIKQNNTITNQIIGAANYDIGHLFGRGAWDGVSALRSVCKSTKGRGKSNRKPNGSMQKHARTVMHEIGHQFGAKHTQNNDCNRSSDSSYEPGSGSTLMSYAGVCSPNIVGRSDLYYHIKSLKQIHAYITQGSGNNCANIIENPNIAPTVDAGEDYVIPISTPFKLTASSFSDDENQLTFSWEQYDKEVAQMPPLSTNAKGPSFRSFSPTTSPTRYFPKMNKITANNLTSNWQCLPSVARIMHFRVTARDNSSNLAGCISDDNMKVTITDTSGPFLVTYPSNQNITWQVGENKTIVWDVANTQIEPVNCQNVDILLSVDGGNTYPIILASNVVNSGNAEILVPDAVTETARVMILAKDNIFFDISDENFEIIGNPLGIDSHLEVLNYQVYPNPANDKIIFKINNKSAKVKIEIYSSLGQQVDVFNISNDKLELSLRKYYSGVYLFKITGLNSTFYGKFIKK